MRVIARNERPHPGARLRLTDADGHRVTCFATNSTADLPALDLRHRRRARCEDRIRNANDTGARNLSYRQSAANAVWLQIVCSPSCSPPCCSASAGTATSPWRSRNGCGCSSAAGRLIRTGRRRILDLDRGWPWTKDILAAAQRLDTLAA